MSVYHLVCPSCSSVCLSVYLAAPLFVYARIRLPIPVVKISNYDCCFLIILIFFFVQWNCLSFPSTYFCPSEELSDSEGEEKSSEDMESGEFYFFSRLLHGNMQTTRPVDIRHFSLLTKSPQHCLVDPFGILLMQSSLLPSLIAIFCDAIIFGNPF
ncbi:hypothetical protein AHF37_02232 [Paragonimus kellicotti]|nr:hypothetical protein AHF37_02232 [Paragonimus kellicotti]